MAAEPNKDWSAVLADPRGIAELATTEVGPSLWLVGLGTVIPVEWLLRLAAIESLELMAIQVRSIGARSETIGQHWADASAREVGQPLWSEVIPTESGGCAYWASICEPPGLEALTRSMSGSTAARDTLLVLTPDRAQLNADAVLPSLFLRHVLGDVGGEERIAEAKSYARQNGAAVAFELRDPDQNIGLALTDGTDAPPWNVVGQFQSELGGQVDGLHPGRFWPVLSQ